MAALGADEKYLVSPRAAIVQAQKLIEQGQRPTAENHLKTARQRFPNSSELTIVFADFYFELERWGAAEKLYESVRSASPSEHISGRLEDISQRYERATASINMAVIIMQKDIDAGRFATAIAIGKVAIKKFPQADVILKETGQALYMSGELNEAEVTFRRALQINPFNAEARAYVEEIRSTEQAQTSREFQEWISIAKDKVGDFIVTFLALFFAFVVNSAIAPIVLAWKLYRARRMVERDNYEEFTDLIEGLLDLENFAPLRHNFRFLLNRRSYGEAQEILNRHVSNLDCLPTLLRILEREHEKMVVD